MKDKCIEINSIFSPEEIEVHKLHLQELCGIIESKQDNKSPGTYELEECLGYLYKMQVDSRELINLIVINNEVNSSNGASNIKIAIDAVLQIYKLMQVFKVVMNKG